MEAPRLLSLEEVVHDEAALHLTGWWTALSAVARARGRWVFIEPEGLPQPRQRACYELSEMKELLNVRSDDKLERHNRSSLFKIPPGPHIEGWKNFALKTTNQVYQLPMPELQNKDKVSKCCAFEVLLCNTT